MMISQMINNNGNAVANQFIIEEKNKTTFQSYKTKIAQYKGGKLTLDENALNYSRTTNKHLYIFTNSDRNELQEGIKNGSISTKNLNK